MQLKVKKESLKKLEEAHEQAKTAMDKASLELKNAEAVYNERYTQKEPLESELKNAQTALRNALSDNRFENEAAYRIALLDERTIRELELKVNTLQ